MNEMEFNNGVLYKFDKGFNKIVFKQVTENYILNLLKGCGFFNRNSDMLYTCYSHEYKDMFNMFSLSLLDIRHVINCSYSFYYVTCLSTERADFLNCRTFLENIFRKAACLHTKERYLFVHEFCQLNHIPDELQRDIMSYYSPVKIIRAG